MPSPYLSLAYPVHLLLDGLRWEEGQATAEELRTVFAHLKAKPARHHPVEPWRELGRYWAQTHRFEGFQALACVYPPLPQGAPPSDVGIHLFAKLCFRAALQEATWRDDASMADHLLTAPYGDPAERRERLVSDAIHEALPITATLQAIAARLTQDQRERLTRETQDLAPEKAVPGAHLIWSQEATKRTAALYNIFVRAAQTHPNPPSLRDPLPLAHLAHTYGVLEELLDHLASTLEQTAGSTHRDLLALADAGLIWAPADIQSQWLIHFPEQLPRTIAHRRQGHLQAQVATSAMSRPRPRS